MTATLKISGENGQPKMTTTFSQDLLESALIDLDDMMARAALPYFIIGQTAKQMVNRDKLSGDGLDVGVRRNELVPTALSTINTLQPELKLDGTEDGFTYFWQGVPIRVQYIDPNEEMFKRADKVWHNAWEYSIPNPWKEYLKTL